MSRSTTNWLFVSVMVVIGIFLSHPSALLGKPSYDEYVDLAGLVIASTGLAIRVVSRHWKIKHGSGGLVISGPYSVIRHPLYLGSFLAGVGLCLILGNTSFLMVFTVGYMLFHIRIARKEEQYLLGVWPEEYSNYMADVPGWIPSLNRVVGIARQCVNCFNRESVLRERSAVCGILAGAGLLEAWADYAMEGWLRARVEVIACMLFVAVLCLAMLVLRNTVARNCESQ